MNNHYRVGNSVIEFRSKSLVFAKKKWANERFAQKVSDSLMFGKRSERSLTIVHSFWATWANRSRSLICPERLERFAHFAQKEWAFLKKNFQKMWKRTKIRFFQIFLSELFIFFSKREHERFAQKTERFAHLSWATWANRSHSLICHERPERFAYSRSFVLSDLSESLTFTNLSWATWANSQPWTIMRISVHFLLHYSGE